jgi:formylglycine-generating enzyme
MRYVFLSVAACAVTACNALPAKTAQPVTALVIEPQQVETLSMIQLQEQFVKARRSVDRAVAGQEAAQALIAALTVSPAPPRSCAEGMVEVEGDYCPNVEEVCLRWVDIHGETLPAPTGKYAQSGRCGEFKKPTRCLSKQRVHMHYCIDEYESGDVEGQRPRSWVSWYDAKKILMDEGKRLCTTAEWTFACEGQDIQPYPYGDGYHRDTTACNFDNQLPLGLDVFKARRPGDATSLMLDSMLVASGENARCVSPFGVHDQVGNLDEWIDNTGGYKVSGLMGGHIWGVRSRCRAVTDGHGPTFAWYETTYRGCKDTNTP